MKVLINGTYYDTKSTAVYIVFEDDSERIKAGENISNMEPKEGFRVYASFPEDMDKNVVQSDFDKIIKDFS